MFHLPMTGVFKRGKKERSKETTADNGERRYCRFQVPGAQVGVRVMEKKGFRMVPGEMEYFPLSDLSRGGLRFPSNRLFKANTPIEVSIFLVDDEPIELRGKVRWFGVYPGISYTYHIGIQFLPFAEKADSGHNDAKLGERLAGLEEAFGESAEEVRADAA